jgi:hypothetical protein
MHTLKMFYMYVVRLARTVNKPYTLARLSNTMIIKDLRFIQATDKTDNINGGVGAFTGGNVSANGGVASADVFAEAFGQSTTANTLTGTRSAAGPSYSLSAATGAGTATAVTVDGKNSSVATSVFTGVATDVQV